MIPVDARLSTDRDVELGAVPLGKVLTSVDGAKKLRLVMLDACRDNPFVNQIRRTSATRSIGRGLGRVEPGPGTLVVYAAKHGETALDGEGSNSPFATALLSLIRTPALEVRRLFDIVRDEVVQSTKGRQQPFSYGSLSGREDYFFQRVAAAPPTPAVPRPSPSPNASNQPSPPVPQSQLRSPKDCADCPDMVSIPLGSFIMGASADEEVREGVPSDRRGWAQPQHPVRLTEAFSLGRYEVTRKQYAAFVAATGRVAGDICWGQGPGRAWMERSGMNWLSPGIAQEDDEPVVCVSWNDAQAYVEWLSRITGKKYRLPSESEWEYAARAGSSASRYWGTGRKEACEYANGHDLTAAHQLYGRINSDNTLPCRDGHAYMAPVGTFKANSWALHDMLGNVSEWTADCWNESYSGAPSDQKAWSTGQCRRHVFRGGNWDTASYGIRSAQRNQAGVDVRSMGIGFRVARSD